jgi:hypothetical protein
MRIRTIAVFVLFASAASMPGQTFGEITGEIRDASGGVVASAAVTGHQPGDRWSAIR